MTNVQKLVDIANKQAYDMCKGDATWLAKFGNNPYTILNGEWYFDGKKLAKDQQNIQTQSISFALAQQILEESVA
jgi:hypothetical protein